MSSVSHSVSKTRQPKCTKKQPIGLEFALISLWDPLPRFVGHCVAQSKHVAGLVVLPLNRIRRASIVEAEHFVGQVETRNDQMEPAVHPDTRLRVHLRMAVQ